MMDQEMSGPEAQESVHLEWRALFETQALSDKHFRAYWRSHVPRLFSPRPDLLVPVEEHPARATLYEPLEKFIFDGQLLSDALSGLQDSEPPPALCGRVFKMGEPTYSCRDCGMDPTCVLCVDCFKLSAHRGHRYKMSTSCGGGYCDCGDREAWKVSPFCDRHAASAVDASDERILLPSPPLVARARTVFQAVLDYCHQMLCWEEPVNLPTDLVEPDMADVPTSFATMLFNDEIHTYEQVIRTLTRAISCPQKEAIDFATTVDREGRSIVKCGPFAACRDVKGVIERITSQHGPKPLRVVVMDPRVVAHQTFALRLLAWFQQLIGGSQAFRLLFSEVVSAPRRDERPILEGVIRNDARLWKTARFQWHQLFISGMLMKQESKQTFARVFTRNYPSLMKDFIEDDHDHSLSITSLSVQIFTVPTIAHMLIVEEDVLATVLRTFCTECEVKLNADSKLAFERNHGGASFRRAQFVLFDLKYLLISKPDVWDNALRKNFLHGFAQLLKLLTWMQGMDSTVRQVGQHMEFEPDWESAFNLYIKLSSVITLVLDWCSSDRVVFVKAYRATLKSLAAVLGVPPKVVQEVADHSVACVSFDVSCQPMSIHMPLTRLLAGLHLHLDAFGLSFDSPEFAVRGKPSPALLMELPLRTQVMVAQVHAGMWRRNGYSLLNQIYFYRNVRCRYEMYDRDVVMLQVGASLVEHDEFVVHLLYKFGLMNWVREDYELRPPRVEEDRVRLVVTLVEEFLELLLVVVSERHVPGVGRVTDDERIRKEIVQQLCIEPMAHSQLSKALSEDANHETGLESVIERVATFRKPARGCGVYELRPECRAEYNPFFYHYTREELSRAEEAERRRRRAAAEDAADCCPPPPPPPFAPSFATVVHVLQCDVMLHVMRIVLERSLNLRARSSDGQLLRLLHLIGYALHEEQYGADSAFQFTARSSKENILVLLDALATARPPRGDAHRDLLVWVLQRFRRVAAAARQGDAAMDTAESTAAAADERRGAEALREEKRRRAEMAAARRNRIMSQMSAMQRNFIREHAELFEQTTDDDATLSMDVTAAADDDEADRPPVCVGDKQTPRQWIPSRHVCILCQEDQDVTLGGRAMVLSALVQRSTVLSRERDSAATDGDPLLPPADLRCAPHTSTCGHVMHADCWQKYFDLVLAKERRRPVRTRYHVSFDVDKQEFLCPLCECLGNTVIPIVPGLGTVLPELSDRKVDMPVDSWLDFLHSVVRHARQKTLQASLALERNVDDDDEEEEDDDDAGLRLPSLDDLRPHLDADVAQKLARFYPSTDAAPPLQTQQLSAGLVEMMKLYATSAYTVGLGLHPHPEDARVALMAWFSCAFTIRATEVLVRFQDKPLFGALSSRQSDCLAALVRFCGVCTNVGEPAVLEAHCRRLLETLLGEEPTRLCLADVDAFALLVNLVLLLPVCVGGAAGGCRDASACVPHGDGRDAFALRFVYLLHIVQILLTTDVDPDDLESLPPPLNGEEDYSALVELNAFVRLTLDPRSEAPTDAAAVDRLVRRVRRLSVPFLRCCALFFHYLTGVPAPEALTQELNGDGGSDHHAALTRYLGMSSNFSELLVTPGLSRLLSLWLSHPRLTPNGQLLPLQRPFDVHGLVPLPADYSEMINDASLFTCPNSDGEDSRTPTMCLVCGKMLCSQSYCCQTELDGALVGACTNHAHYCGAGVGIFLRVRECKVLLLAGKTKGCFVPPPYLDEYGETDQGLRRGNPLHLCHENYRKLQKLWLSHGIPEEIAHSLESNTHILTVEWHHL